MCLLQYTNDIHEGLVRVALMLLHTLRCRSIKCMVHFESLMLLSSLDTKVLVVNFNGGLDYADCVPNTPAWMGRGMLIRKLGLKLQWNREWILE